MQRLLMAAKTIQARSDSEKRVVQPWDLEEVLCDVAQAFRDHHAQKVGARSQESRWTSWDDLAKSFREDEKDPLQDPSAGIRAYVLLALSPRTVCSKFGLNVGQLRWMQEKAKRMYADAVVDAGEAIGSLAAMSASEPITQLTLNTFHSSGIAVTQVVTGLQAMMELTNADDTKTKQDRMALSSQATIRFKEPFCYSERYAKHVAQSLQSVALKDVLKSTSLQLRPMRGSE